MNQKTIVVITNKHDTDSDLVIKRLNENSENVVRLNTEDFPTRISFVFNPTKPEMVFRLPCNRIIDIKEVKSVLYRKPDPHTIDPQVKDEALRVFAQRESQAIMYAFYECFKGLWVNHPLKIRSASQKIYQLQTAKKLGFQIPATLVTNEPKKAKSFCLEHKQGGVIVKPLSFPIVDGDKGYYAFSTALVRKRNLMELNFIRYAPTLFQARIPKKYELRITVVDNQVFPCKIYSQVSEKTKLDWRFFDQENLILHKAGKICPELEKKCVKLVKTLGLSFGAIDMVLTPNNQYIFLEINASGMWGWIEYLTGLPISQAMANLLSRGKDKK